VENDYRKIFAECIAVSYGAIARTLLSQRAACIGPSNGQKFDRFGTTRSRGTVELVPLEVVESLYVDPSGGETIA
jgi:hypothetical protein